jgi:hypothetical protein
VLRAIDAIPVGLRPVALVALPGEAPANEVSFDDASLSFIDGVPCALAFSGSLLARRSSARQRCTRAAHPAMARWRDHERLP